jgi:hypothetical protein
LLLRLLEIMVVLVPLGAVVFAMIKSPFILN